MFNGKIGFIGCGNIANAIIHGALSSGYIKSDNLVLFDTDTGKLLQFINNGAHSVQTIGELVNLCDYVFLTVKPQIFEIVLPQIGAAPSDTCFITVAAGITVNYIKRFLGESSHIIRVMPNTPLMFAEGSTAIFKNDFVSEDEYSFIKGIFECSGVVEEVNEDEFNLITAISGSSPAFVMNFAKCIIEFAESNGLNRQTAENLVIQVFSGTANMVKKSDKDIIELIKNVTSPNGTTEAGLKSLEKNNFDKIVTDCLKETVVRADELTK